MSVQGVGQEFSLGIIPATTWHTAVALAAGTRLKLTSVSPLYQQRSIDQDNCLGENFARRLIRGLINQDFNFQCPLRYENNHLVHLFQLFGAETGSVDTGVYTHQADFDANISGLFYTAAGIMYDSATAFELFEWPSVKPISVELSFGGDGFVQMTGQGIADQFLNESYGVDNGVVNTVTTVYTTSTVQSHNYLVANKHCRLNINAYGGATFDSTGDGSDRLYPSNVIISIKRPLIRDFSANRLSSDSGDANTFRTMEPKPDDRPWEVFLTLEFPIFDSDIWVDAFRANTEYKAEVYFYDTADRNLRFQFPYLLPYEPSIEVSKLGRIPQSITFQCLYTTTPPSGMTGIYGPVRMTLENSYSKQYDDASAIT